MECQDALVIELCGISSGDDIVMDVKEWAQNQPSKSLLTDLEVSCQIIRGVSYLHSKDVIHCDLKPSNCLVVGSMSSVNVKLADFGISYYRTVTHTETQGSQALYSQRGTPIYAGPESFEGALGGMEGALGGM